MLNRNIISEFVSNSNNATGQYFIKLAKHFYLHMCDRLRWRYEVVTPVAVNTVFNLGVSPFL